MFDKFKDLITTQPDVMTELLAEPFYFEPKAVGYHPNNAYSLARVASLAYEDEKTIKEKAPKLFEKEPTKSPEKEPPKLTGKEPLKLFKKEPTKSPEKEPPKLTEKEPYSLKEMVLTIIKPDVNVEVFRDIYSGVSIRETEAIVLENSEVVIVAFRGTEMKIVDWITDVHCRHSTKGCGGYGVHHGMYEALMSVWKDIEPHIKNKGKKTLWFTGHSLGGGLAALATANCLFDPNLNITPNGLYTYGQPKIGGEDFVKAFNAKFKNQAFRFINNNDIVPLLAPSLSELPVQLPNLVNYLPKLSVEPLNVLTAIEYYHTGHFRQFDKNGTLQDESFGMADRAADLIAGYLESALKLGPGSLRLGITPLVDRVDALGDHFIAKYVANLKQHRDEWAINNPKTSNDNSGTSNSNSGTSNSNSGTSNSNSGTSNNNPGTSS